MYFLLSSTLYPYHYLHALICMVDKGFFFWTYNDLETWRYINLYGV